MAEPTASIRQLKADLLNLLSCGNWDDVKSAVIRMPLKKIVNPLFSFFCSKDPLVYWRSISVMGEVVSLLADTERESALVVMRRLMWNLNEESGGIGWGCPEAMGEIMARNDWLAREFACILISYINPHANFIGHPVLQRGILWGLGRLANERPARTADASDFLPPFLSAPDPYLRGLAAWTAAANPLSVLKPLLMNLSDDHETISFYYNGFVLEKTIGSLAQFRTTQDEPV